MKKIIALYLLAFPFCADAVSLEADISAFFPLDSVIQGIYGNLLPDVGIAIDHMQPFERAPELSFFGQVDYIFGKGRSIGCNLACHQNTHIRLIPLTAGLKWIRTINDRVEVYVGAAPKYYFMHIHNDTSFVPCTSNEHGCGGYGVAGAFFYPVEHFMMNIFLSYSYIKFHAPCSTPAFIGFSTNVAGFNFGFGMGWNF